MVFNIFGFLKQIKDSGVDAVQDLGAKAGNEIVKDLKIQGNPTIVITGSTIKISTEGQLNIVDVNRNKTLMSLDIPLNVDIKIPDMKIPINVDGKLMK